LDWKPLNTIGTIVLALILALVIWVNATYVEDAPRAGDFSAPIPINVLNAPADMVAVNDPITSVAVEIRAFTSSWNKLTPGHFSVSADWSDLPEGQSEVPLVYECSDKTVTILSVEPEMQFVTLEQIETQGFDVIVDLQDQEEIPLGYRVQPPQVKPERVSVTGPASAVGRVASLRVALSVFNQTTSLERISEPVPYDEAGRVVQAVTLEPRTVSIQVTIEKKQNYREVVVRARTVGQPDQGYFVSDVNMVPSTVTIIGPPDVIETMGGLVDLKHEIDISGATRMVSDKIELDLPEGVSVVGAQEGQTTEVLVTVGIDAVTGGTTLELPLRLANVPENLVAHTSISIVDVILTGPSVLLDDLEVNRMDAYLDLRDLGRGTHQVRPQVEILGDQEAEFRDLVIKDIAPQSVEVVIEPPPTATPTPTIEYTPTPRPTATLSATLSITEALALIDERALEAEIEATATSTNTPTSQP